MANSKDEDPPNMGPSSDEEVIENTVNDIVDETSDDESEFYTLDWIRAAAKRTTAKRNTARQMGGQTCGVNQTNGGWRKSQGHGNQQ